MGIEVGFFVGVLILLAAIAYGAVAYSRRNRGNEPVTEEATRELYRDENSYGGKEDDLRARTRT